MTDDQSESLLVPRWVDRLPRGQHIFLVVVSALFLVLAVLNAIGSDRPGFKFLHGSLAIVMALVIFLLVRWYIRRPPPSAEV